MRKRYTITLIPGDGIGPEITKATIRVLEAAGVHIDYKICLAGKTAEQQYGCSIPKETLECLYQTKVGLKGPLIVEPGSPPIVIGKPPRIYGSPNAALRGECHIFANVRPVKRFNGVPGRFSDLPINIVVVREVSEGIYVGGERKISSERAEATVVATQKAAERIIHFGFKLARNENRKKVTFVHKANVLPYTDGLYFNVFYSIAREYPEIVAEDRMIDAATAQMVLNPLIYDVIIAPNQYGDILSDLAAAIVGGLGLGPGGNYGEKIAFFEACHGAAPDIAGKNIANPIGLILSGAMMLDYLGENEAADRIRKGVEEFLKKGEKFTPDLGGTGTTMGIGESIAYLIETAK
jgi:isocitrate dehydrogenase (NAD+)